MPNIRIKDLPTTASATVSGDFFGVDSNVSTRKLNAFSPTFGGNLVVSGTGTINGTTIPASKTLVVTTDKLSALASTSSAELAGVISDETGTGALVFANTPTLVTPNIGAATGTSFNLSGSGTLGTTLVVNGTTDSSSKDTGAIVTEGGLGVEKSATIGLNATINGTLRVATKVIDTSGGYLYGGSSNDPGTIGAFGDLSGNAILTISRATGNDATLGAGFGNLNLAAVSNVKTGNVFQVTNTTASSSTSTGALVVSGGVGVAGSAYVGGALVVTNKIRNDLNTSIAGDVAGSITNLSATGYGLRVQGGASGSGYIFSANDYTGSEKFQISGAGNATFAGEVTVSGIDKSILLNGASTQFSREIDIRIAGDTEGRLLLRGGGSLLWGNGSGTFDSALARTSANMLTITGALTVSSTTASTSTSTGALIVSGGVGVAKDLYVGGTVITLQPGSGTTAPQQKIIGPSGATYGPSLFLDASASTSGKVYIVGSGLSGDNGGLGSFYVYDVSAANSVLKIVGGNTTLAGTLSVSGTGTSAFAGPITASTSATNTYLFDAINTNAAGYSLIRFENTGASGRSFDVGVGGATSGQPGLFYIYDNLAFATRLSISSAGSISLPTTTASTSTSTGALVVSGGVGVAGAINVGGKVQFPSDTTSARAVAFGSDINFFRRGNNTFGFTGSAGSGIQLTCGTDPYLQGIAGSGYIRFFDAGSTVIASSGTTALTIDSNQNAAFSGATVYVSKAGNNPAFKATDGTIVTKVQSVSAGDTAGYIGTESLNPLKIVTNNTAALTITTGQQVQANATTASTSTSTGALVVSGGVGVAGAVYAGGKVVVNGGDASAAQFAVAGASGTLVANLTAGTTTNQSFGLRMFAGTSASDYGLFLRNVTDTTTLFKVDGVGGTTIGGALTVNSKIALAAQAAGTTLIDLQSTDDAVILGFGGVTKIAFGGNLALTASNVGRAFAGATEILRWGSGVVNVYPTTASTSTSTGALVVSGGVGVAKEVYVGKTCKVGTGSDNEGYTNVFTNKAENTAGPFDITLPSDCVGVVFLNSYQSGVGRSFREIPFICFGGTVTLGTSRTTVLTADPVTSVAAAASSKITISLYAANTNCYWGIYVNKS